MILSVGAPGAFTGNRAMRGERLNDLIVILRDGALHRAEDLARRTGVSTRTIWRDMATLRQSGLPVGGERGVGYMLTAPITLPPVALTQAEWEALRLGIALVASGADPGLAYAAHALSQKFTTVAPGAAPPPALDAFVFAGPEAARAAPWLPAIRAAIVAGEKLDLDYRDLAGRGSAQRVRPLQLEYWGRHWSLVAWCERRRDFRSYRVDLVRGAQAAGAYFVAEPGKTLADYRARAAATPSP